MKNNFKKVLSAFPSLDSDLRLQALESLLCWADHIEDLYVELKGLDFLTLMKNRDDGMRNA
jgi:hypothetical protein